MLEENLSCDDCIVGSGSSGAHCAYFFADTGLNVVLGALFGETHDGLPTIVECILTIQIAISYKVMAEWDGLQSQLFPYHQRFDYNGRT